MTTKPDILDGALEVLRAGDTLTLDAVATRVGITKPGVVHHFRTKEALAVAVVEHLLDVWEAELARRVGPDATPTDLLRAYVEHTLLGSMDPADLALMAEPRLQEKLSAHWAQRMDAWFGTITDPRLLAVRLIADGAWVDRCLGVLDADENRRGAVVRVAAQLMEEAGTQ